MIRVHGDIRRINLPAMEHKDVHGMIYDIMNDGQRKHYEENLECDFSFAIPGLARFRVNAFVQNRGAAAVMRTIPSKILSLEELGTPKIFTEIVDQPRGIVLVTGPTGSGKSTTFAAMVNQINDNEQGHILTIEDPLEFVSESIRAIIAQTRCKTKDGGGRVAAHEIMIGTPAIRNLIRENKVAQMYSAIQTGQQFGMQTLDQNLQELVRRNVISSAEARGKAANKDNFPG